MITDVRTVLQDLPVAVKGFVVAMVFCRQAVDKNRGAACTVPHFLCCSIHSSHDGTLLRFPARSLLSIS